MKLFISYARVDKPLCKQVVERLSDVHDVWYDKRLHAGQEWWQEIQEYLAWCEGFVYLLSPESVASEYCQKEFAIAANAGKHLFPVLIQARTAIPDALSHLQYADLSNGMEDVITLMNALTIAERQQRKPAAPPIVNQASETAPKAGSPNQALADAADVMDAKDFDKAVFIIKQALSQNPEGRSVRLLENMLKEAEAALEKQTHLREAEREYAPILALSKRESTRALACEEFVAFQKDFPDYDPDSITTVCQQLAQKAKSVITTQPETKPAQAQVIEVKPPVVVKASKPSSLDLMPQPFAWIDIPNKGYSIAKFPVTNAQFAEFIKAGGYQRLSSEDGRVQHHKYNWIEPGYWQDTKFNGANQPVLGVSWYEAVSFSMWLREQTGEKIMLPTEEQWQYAAQGDDGRAYPWGNEWDANRCNNHVDGKGIGKTTPVTQYEGIGDSPFGVVDMVGNVSEWCSNSYDDDETKDFNSKSRVLRGGAWLFYYSDMFRCDARDGYEPYGRFEYFGFRLRRND